MTNYIEKLMNACINGNLKKANFYYDFCYENIDSNIFVQIYNSMLNSNVIYYDVLKWLINTPEIIIEFEFFDKYEFLNNNIYDLNINLELFKWIYNELMKNMKDKECIERMLYISACSVGNIELVSWFISNNNDLKYEIEGFKLAAFGHYCPFTICMKTGTYTFPKPKPSKIISLLMSLSPFLYQMSVNNCTILTKEVAINREKRYYEKLLLASCLQEVNNNFKVKKCVYYVLGNEDLLRNVAEYL